MAQITLRVFASLRDKLGGNDSLDYEIANATTVADLLTELGETYPVITEYAASLQIAVNMDLVPRSHEVKEGDEVALLPPVSGG